MDVLVVGGGYAGLACALRLARRAGAAARVRLVSPDPRFVERIRLHQAASGQRLPERRLDTLLARAGVDWVAGRVARVDASGRCAILADGRTLRWDRLVLAAGSGVGDGGVPGVAEHALAIEPHTVAAVHERLRALPAGAHVAVVGGGLTGLETATEVAESFPALGVHLVSHGAVAGDFGDAARAYVGATLSRFGITRHEGAAVQAVEAGRLHTTGGTIAFDLCLWTAGFTVPPLAREAGLAVDADGRLLVDPQLRSVSNAAVYGAGDACRPVIAPGDELPMGCKSALPTGAQVGDNLAREIAGRPPAAFDFALPFYCVSLGRRAGLVQWPGSGGRLDGRLLRGRTGARFKEAICRMTWWSLVAEAEGLPGVGWLRSGRAPQTLDAAAASARPPAAEQPA